MYKEKHFGSDFMTFEQHQLNGWSTDIAQPITLLTDSLLMLFNQAGASNQVS